MNFSIGVVLLAFASSANSQVVSVPGNDNRESERLVIGLDMSASNPLVDDSNYAGKVASRVAARIRELPVKSEVMIRPLGLYNSTANDALRMDFMISANNRPEDLAMKVEQLIAGIPDFVANGKLRAEGYTNILAFLENMGEVIDCATLETTYILVSDGIEDSPYANLHQSSGTLPRDVLRTETGKCEELQILGVGRGLASPQDTKRIRDEWRDWAVDSDANPFRRFVGLNDW